MKKFVFDAAGREIKSRIYCGANILVELLEQAMKRRPTSVFAVVDEKAAKLHSEILSHPPLKGAKILNVASGERSKSEKMLWKMLEWLYSGEADRGALLVAVGGGVVTDLTGFAASCYMRGIRFVSVPTTLVGQVDAAIGGKTGINLHQTKNMVGSFYPPEMVICDQLFLRTLSDTQIKDGLMEAIKVFAAHRTSLFHKHALLLTGYLRNCQLNTIVADAIRTKVEIVNRDPFEHDLRKVLNFGHTTGHAYEVLSKVSHGKAVALGMLVALTLSREHAGLAQSDFDEIWSAVTSIYSRFKLMDFEARILWEKISHDKKRSGKNVNFVLLRKCGSHSLKSLTFRQFSKGMAETTEKLDR